jgi:hypothetical protein
MRRIPLPVDPADLARVSDIDEFLDALADGAGAGRTPWAGSTASRAVATWAAAS